MRNFIEMYAASGQSAAAEAIYKCIEPIYGFSVANNGGLGPFIESASWRKIEEYPDFDAQIKGGYSFMTQTDIVLNPNSVSNSKEPVKTLYEKAQQALQKGITKIYVSKYAIAFINSTAIGGYGGFGTRSYDYLNIAITFPSNDPYVIAIKKNFKDITDEAISNILFDSIKFLIDSKWTGLPSIYTEDITPTPVKRPGLYKLRDGSIINLPKISNNVKIFKEALSQGTRLRNFIININEKQRVIQYLDKDGKPSIKSYFGAVRLTDKDRVGFLDRPFSSLWQNDGVTNLGAIYDWNRFNAELSSELNKIRYPTDGEYIQGGLLNVKAHENIGAELDLDVARKLGNTVTMGDALYQRKDQISELVDKLRAMIESKNTPTGTNNVTGVVTTLKFNGYLGLLQQCIDRGVLEVKSESIKKQIDFDNTSADEVPEIPNLSKEVALFPHQAKTIAKLDKAGELAIVDVATGGGKTITIICDILNLLNKGKIKRPLIIMPDSLIGQWASQISYFTGGTINTFPITSKILQKYKWDNLEPRVAAAPINTIFLTTYSFIVRGKKEDDYGTVFDGAEEIVDYINPDYVALDESHIIKNPKKIFNKAATIVGADVAYKRIATGTLINNNPEDLIGQTGFLDPGIVGDRAEFKSRYRLPGRKDWAPDFADRVRSDLKVNANYIMYRKKDWAPLLPKVEYKRYFVDMNKEQAAVYKQMVLKLMDEIQNDPVLGPMWNDLVESNEDTEIPRQLLGKLGVLEQYLTAPEMHGLIAKLGDKAVSPKLPIIDQLIGESIEQGGKVIVAVHYKESARHLMNYSKYKSQSVYYDAANKDVVPDFINNNRIKVIFAVVQSLKEGYNLQVANRVIIADVDWTPGNAEQLEARILRPNIKYVDNNPVNLNKNKVIHIDTVCCNDSADVFKFMLQSYKRLANAKIMENSPVALIRKPKFTNEALVATFGDSLVGGQMAVDRIDEFEGWQLKVIDEEKAKGELNFVGVKTAPTLKGSAFIETPWVVGMELPVKDGEMVLSDYLETVPGYNHQTRELGGCMNRIKGMVVNTEVGYGTISGISGKTKILVKLFKTGKNFSTDPNTTIVAPNTSVKQAMKIDSDDAKAKQAKKKKVIGERPAPKKQEEQQPVAPAAKPQKQNKPVDYDDITVDADEFPDGSITREKLNHIAERFGVVISRKRNDDGGFDYRWKLKNENMYVDINGVESLNDKTWKQWVISMRNAAKKFAKAVAKKNDDNSQQQEQPKPKKSTSPVADNKIRLDIGTYNDIPMLIAYPEDPDSMVLADKYGFKLFPPNWSFEVKTRPAGYAALERIKKAGFKIPKTNLKEIETILDDMKKGKYPYQFPDESVRNFLRLNKVKAPRGMLKVYPMIIGETVFLVVDKHSHPGVSLSRFRFTENEPFFGYIAPSVSHLRMKLQRVMKHLKVVNLKEITKMAKNEFKIIL